MAFNPETFMSSAVDPNATSFEVCPEGEYKMMIDSDPKQLTFTEDNKSQVGIKNAKGVSQRTGEPYDFWTLELRCLVLDEEVKKKLGRETVHVRARINLDFAPDGSLDTGPNKNVSLGQLRDAVGQNTPGWTPQQLLGAGPFIGRVRHTANKENPEIKYADVARFARIS